ncbi:MAG: enoyl-CoA hydratase-related protein [Candidatus Neomarinimicrobiota bacterium]
MPYILTDIKNQVAVLTMNRPEVLNAVDLSGAQELEKCIKVCLQNPAVGVIILTGSGNKAFVAGADIKKMHKMDSKQAEEFGFAGQSMTLTIENSTKPVIAAINGFALGGGCEISLACHIRIASEEARFALPEVSLGILPGWGGTQRLPKLVGMGLAIEMITTGRLIKAAEGFRIGLINHVVPAERLMGKAQEIAELILKNGPNAIAAALNCLQAGAGLSTRAGLKIEQKYFAALFETKEAKEGLSAFLGKRNPDFR